MTKFCESLQQAKVVDPATGEMVPVGNSGELMIRGYCVMLGYWDDPEKTSQVISQDRWYRTGYVQYILNVCLLICFYQVASWQSNLQHIAYPQIVTLSNVRDIQHNEQNFKACGVLIGCMFPVKQAAGRDSLPTLIGVYSSQ